jgi:WD40 repeat protein
LLERLRQPLPDDAWARFVRLYTPLLYYWARRLGCQDSDAADLVQDVFAALTEKLPHFVYDEHRSFRRWVPAGAAGLLLALGLAAYPYGAAVLRILTNQGQLVIETDDPDVAVIVQGQGQKITIQDLKTRTTVDLRAGEWQLQLAGGKEGLRLSTDHFTLRRGDQTIVTVRRELAAPKPKGPEVLHALRRFTGYDDGVTSVALSPEGTLALSGGRDGSVRLWDVGTGVLLHRFPKHEEMVWAVAFGPNGRRAASAGGGGYPGGGCNWGTDHDIRIWDVTGRKEHCRLRGHAAPVMSLAFSPDGSRLLSGDIGGITLLWDISAGRELKRLPGGSVWGAVAFHPHGTLALCAGADNTVRLWDLKTGEVVRRFVGHERAVRSVAFSLDGRLALSGSLDRTARLWDVGTGKQRHCLTHPTVVNDVAFTVDGRWAVSCSGAEPAGPSDDAGMIGAGRDNLVRLWDVITGAESYRLEGHDDNVMRVAVSAGGRYVLSGSHDRTLRLWRLP